MTFVKLTEADKAQTPVWVNLDLVRTMHRLEPWEGTTYSDQDATGAWVEYVAGARPERTRLSFGTTAQDDDDFVEVLETPEELLSMIAKADRGAGSSDAP